MGVALESDLETNRYSSGHSVLFIFAMFWVVAGTLGAKLVEWFIEQAIFEGSFKILNIRWVFILGYSFWIILPFLILSLVLKPLRYKAIYRSWWLVGLYVLFSVPARLARIEDAQLTALLQILGMSIYVVGVGVWFWLKVVRTARQQNEIIKVNGSIVLALMAGGVLLIPWILWGALGSPMDILLNLIQSLLFGLAASLTLPIHHTAEENSQYRKRDFVFEGLVCSIILFIMSAGLGESGNQWILLILLPIMGWICVGISGFGHAEKSPGNWLATACVVSLAVMGPLLWIDADELMFIISSGAGELMEWAFRMTLVSAFAGILIAFILLLLTQKLRRTQSLPVWVKVMPGLLWVGILMVYIFGGRTGFYGERLFVIMKDQQNVSSFTQIADYNQRRAAVYQALVSHADWTQANLRADLVRFGIRYRSYYLVNGLEVQGGPIIRLWLANRPDVDRVLDNPVLRPLPAAVPVTEGTAKAPQKPDWNLTFIHADRVWNELHVTGKGVIVGESDTGVQADHPELVDGYRGKGGSSDYNWFDPWNHSESPVDIVGHGTHTLGSILGKHVGVAPEATWIGCVNLARNLGNIAHYLDCMQFMLAPFPLNGSPFRDGNPTLGAYVLNNSWGCPDVEGCDATVFLPAVKALRAAGIFVVVSAGNSGYSRCGSIEDPPAIYREVYSVGAIDNSGGLTIFSSLGPVLVDGSKRIKPDILAPGNDVLSSYPGSTYEVASGTSMAGPHVVGVVALMWSANPALIGNIDLTESILDQTAMPYQGMVPSCANGMSRPNDAAGYGIVDAYAAVKMALDYKK